jgi:pilus assembly protein Flp/PilA
LGFWEEQLKRNDAMMIRIHRFLRDNAGANLVEYIILVGVIALIAIAGFQMFGNKVDMKIQEEAKKVDQIGE